MAKSTPEQPPLILRDWQNGMNETIANSLLPNNYSRLSLNGYSDETDGNKLGNWITRKGYLQLGPDVQTGKPILGLNYLKDTANTFSYPVAAVNDAGDTEAQTKYYNGSVWSEIGPVPINWEPSTKIRFEPFLGRLFAANGVQALSTWTGVTTDNWSTTDQVTNAPTGTLVRNFLDRMNVAGNPDKRSRLFYSSFPDIDGNITWDVSQDWVDVNPDDNDEITALEPNGSLLIFKNRSTFTWNGFQTQPDILIDVGAVNQEVVQTIKGMTVFFGEAYDTGAVFLYTGQYPKDVSFAIRPWIQAVPRTEFKNFYSFKDNDNYYLSMGNVTKDGQVYPNVCLRYNLPNNAWNVYSLANKPTMRTVFVDTDGDISVLFGDTVGQVHTWNVGTSDNGHTIFSVLRTKQLEFGSRIQIKQLQNFVAYSLNALGATVKMNVEGAGFQDVDSITEGEQIMTKQSTGKWFELEVGYANTGGSQFILDGFEIYGWYSEGYIL